MALKGIAEMNPSLIEIRPANDRDFNFVFKTVFKQVFQYTKISEIASADVFHSEFPKILDYILSKAKVTMAVSKDDPNIIVGFIIHEPSTIHFCFVKQPFRKFGVAKMLMTAAFGSPLVNVKCTMPTRLAFHIMKTHTNIKPNPFILFKQGVISNGQ